MDGGVLWTNFGGNGRKNGGKREGQMRWKSGIENLILKYGLISVVGIYQQIPKLQPEALEIGKFLVSGRSIKSDDFKNVFYLTMVDKRGEKWGGGTGLTVFGTIWTRVE